MGRHSRTRRSSYPGRHRVVTPKSSFSRKAFAAGTLAILMALYPAIARDDEGKLFVPFQLPILGNEGVAAAEEVMPEHTVDPVVELLSPLETR